MIRFTLALCAAMAVITVLLSGILALGYFSYLPLADTWDHIDFFVQAASGHLDIPYLLDRHNGLHLIALPKLVYFLDIYFTQGSGFLTAATSFFFLLLTPLLISRMILTTPGISPYTALGLIALAVVMLASPIQAESLINPANLQWSLFAFTITLTAFCLHNYCQYRQTRWLLASLASLLLCSLTSASFLLTAIPFILVLFIEKKGVHYTLKRLAILCSLVVLAAIFYEIVRSALFTKLPTLVIALASALADDSIRTALEDSGKLIEKDVAGFYLYYLSNIIIFLVHFVSPLSMKAGHALLSMLIACLSIACFITVLVGLYKNDKKIPVFFLYLFFSLTFIALATAGVRSFSPGGYNFRFINLPILFNFSILLLLALTWDSSRIRNIFAGAVFTYLLLFTWISIKDTGEYLFSRNHLRLTPVAYALDIQHWALVEELPGFDTGSFDYEVVMVKKEKLKTAGIGIYASDAYRQVGRAIDENNPRQAITCNYQIESVTKVNEQPAYGMDGSTRSADGKNMTQIWITDPSHRVIGIGNPVIHRRSTYNSFFSKRTWTAYFNPALGEVSGTVDVYAYDEKTICQPYRVTLP